MQQLVLEASSLSGNAFDSAFEALVQEWAGASQIDPSSRGAFVHAQHLAVVYTFFGIDQAQLLEYAVNPNWHSGPLWEQNYREIIDELEVRFASQIAISALEQGSDLDTILSGAFLPFGMLNFDPATDTLIPTLADQNP